MHEMNRAIQCMELVAVLIPTEVPSTPIYESDSDSESSSEVISQGLSEMIPTEATSLSSQVQCDGGSSRSSSLVDSISQLAVSLNDYIGKNMHNSTCSSSRKVLSANQLGVSAQSSHRSSSQKSRAQAISSKMLQESDSDTDGERWSPKAKPQPPVDMSSNSRTMWVPKHLSPTSLLPERTMHYSDPLNFTMRLPRERTEPWSSPPNLRKEVLKQKPLRPPWVTKKQCINAAIPQKTLQASLGARNVDNDSPCSESGVSNATPELPPHPLMCRLGLESSRAQGGTVAVTNDQSEKATSSVHDSVNSSSDLHVCNPNKLIRVVSDVIVEEGLDESASDLEDSLHCGLAGPGLPTQGSLEALHYVLK